MELDAIGTELGGEEHGDPRTFDARTVDATRAMVAEGAPGKALTLLTSQGVHDSSDPEVLQRLKDLHPAGPTLPVPVAAPRVALVDWPDEALAKMRSLVHSFPPASAGGPSGLRPQHLIDVLGAASTQA